jgi:peptidoglycan/LPS O-acetylase OafA/YrhL
VTATSPLASRLTGPTHRRLGWNPALDGVRGVGVVLVMSFHFLGGRYFEGAPILVDLFFVLSGFLITTLLFEERAASGSISFRNFYLRRIFRLFPAMYALLGVFLVYLVIFGGEHRRQLFEEFLAAALYVYNFLVALTGVEGKVLVHLWTLSLEEQFYFIWPILLVGALALGHRARMRGLLAAMAVIIIVFPIIRMTLWSDPSDPGEPNLGLGTPSSIAFGFSILRPDSLVIGCLAAMAWRLEPAEPDERQQRLGRLGGRIGGIMLLMTLCLGGFDLFAPFRSVFYNLTILALPFFVLDLVRRPSTRLASGLSHPWALWFGKRSYSIYMWHNLVGFVVVGFLGDLLVGRTRLVVLVAFPISFALTTGISALSWNHIETPALRYKTRFARPDG